MKEQLKPCPFCGGEPRTVKIRNHFIIECSKCGITTQPLKENEVNEVWNVRVEESDLKKFKERIIEECESAWDLYERELEECVRGWSDALDWVKRLLEGEE